MKTKDKKMFIKKLIEIFLIKDKETKNQEFNLFKQEIIKKFDEESFVKIRRAALNKIYQKDINLYYKLLGC